MNHKWNYRPITQEQAETSRALAQELGISPVLGQLLVQRGITKAQDAKKFFRPQLPDLHDPFLMKDMDIAVERLNMAMGKKERILIYGDYDVDGTTAVALVYKFIQQFYSNLDYYIPDRYNEGYGISKKELTMPQRQEWDLSLCWTAELKQWRRLRMPKRRELTSSSATIMYRTMYCRRPLPF